MEIMPWHVRLKMLFYWWRCAVWQRRLERYRIEATTARIMRDICGEECDTISATWLPRGIRLGGGKCAERYETRPKEAVEMADEKAQVVKVKQAKFVFGDERRGGHRALYGPALPTGGRPQVGWVNEDYVSALEAELEKAFEQE